MHADERAAPWNGRLSFGWSAPCKTTLSHPPVTNEVEQEKRWADEDTGE
jgi:hypothetical protein